MRKVLSWLSLKLLKNESLLSNVAKVKDILKTADIEHKWNQSGASIEKRYVRMDEIWVPYVITVDFESLEDNSYTIHDRDSTNQLRIKAEDLSKIPNDLFSHPKNFNNFVEL